MNISEILKYFPKGTKLYSPIWGEVEFIEVASSNNIVIKSPDGNEVLFYCSGAYHRNGECVLFPSKDQRDWKELKIGDIMMKKNSKYRPFKDTEECWNEMQKHEYFGWIKAKDASIPSRFMTINSVRNEEVSITSGIDFTYNELVEHYTFIDRTPFGVKEEE